MKKKRRKWKRRKKKKDHRLKRLSPKVHKADRACRTVAAELVVLKEATMPAREEP